MGVLLIKICRMTSIISAALNFYQVSSDISLEVSSVEGGLINAL